MDAGPLVTLLALAVLVPCDLWVLLDAGGRARAGRPVVAVIGPFEIEAPQVWAMLCLLLFVIAFPLYLVARRD